MTVYAVNDDAFLGIPYNAKKRRKKKVELTQLLTCRLFFGR
jgi:hypothetical protein